MRENVGAAYGVSVLVISDTGTVFGGAYGYTDTSKRKRVDHETVFNIASVTKSVTAVKAFRLIDQKRIALVDTIGIYVGDVPEDNQSITIDDLLSHRSSFSQNYVCDGLRTTEAALNALLKDTLSFPRKAASVTRMKITSRSRSSLKE